MRSHFAMLSLPLLAAGARHGNHRHHAHARDHGVERRAMVTEVVTVTEVAYTTVTVDTGTQTTAGFSLLMTSSTVSVPAAASAPPSENDKNAAAHHRALTPVAESASVVNSCDYPVYIWSDGHSSCDGEGAKCKRIEPNGTHVEAMRTCVTGGISLKISKTEDASKPMQFEYSVWPQDHSMVSYDISYLNCMNNANGEKDLAECAGHDGGIQAAGGGDCPDYHCLAGEWCDQQAYVVAEFGYLPGAPVGGCKVEKGIAFELCAGNR